jgi:hypothetical protein
MDDDADPFSEPTSLVPAAPTQAARANAAVEKLKAGFEALQRKDLGIVQAMNRFAELPTEWEDPENAHLKLMLTLPEAEIVAAGWKSRKELRMAAYGRMAKKNWPAAMQAAHERVGMRLRKQSADDNRTVFNLNMVTIPAPRRDPDARVVVVDVEESKPRR